LADMAGEIRVGKKQLAEAASYRLGEQGAGD
jgi:hypothetical protein